MIVGCKLLKADGTSLNGKFQYLRGRWQTVPGNGAYIAVTAGLTAGGTGPVLAYFECAEPTGADAPPGVQTYRRVRWIADAPDRISPDLRGLCARHAPGLTGDQRYALAAASTEYWRGWCARDAPDLTGEQREQLTVKKDQL